MGTWAENEFQTLELGDVRRTRRLAQMVDTLVRRPGMSLPRTFRSKADLNAAYYAYNSKRISPQAIRDAHKDATVERVSALPLVIVASDTTSLDFTTHEAVQGLGHLEGRRNLGLLAHTAFAVTPDGLALGSLHQEVWARELKEKGKRHTRKAREVAEKESQKWLNALEAVQQAVPETTTAVLTGDRESDVYALFAYPRNQHVELLVRSAQNRRVEGEHELLHEVVRAVLPCGSLTVEVRAADGRAARTASLSLRYTTLSILPPKRIPKKSGLKPIAVQAVLAEEENAPPGVKTPLCWLLLTTLPVSSAQEAARVVSYYGRRWMVERFHFVLKSGCRIEQLQLGTVEALETALALANIVAWKLLNLTYLARLTPDVSCEAVFEPVEWQALCCHLNQTPTPPKKPPTLRQAARMVAKLGGFLGRKCDGEPGVKTIWQGLVTLDACVAMYVTLSGKRPPRDRLWTFRER